MYIVSEKGNFVPMENVDLIKPTKDGSVVILKTGKRFSDPRTPAQIFEGLVVHETDLAAVVVSIYAELESMTARINTVTTKMEAQFDVATTSIATNTAVVEATISKLAKMSSRVKDSAAGIQLSTNRVDIIVTQLEEAINEAVQVQE